MWYLPLCAWLVSLHVMYFRVIYHVEWQDIFLSLNSAPLCVCTTFSLSISLHILVIGDNAIVNTGVQISSRRSDYETLVRFLDHMILLFLIFEANPYYFPYDCSNLLSYLQSAGVPFTPHPLQHFFILYLFDNSHSNWC
jgi:hypothetical protein